MASRGAGRLLREAAARTVRHDFDCATGHNGWQTSVRFYRIQRAYGVEAIRSGIRAAGVTLAWYCWMKWR